MIGPFSPILLSANEEEELVEQLTKMGENGPIIYDRHFFTLDISRQQDNNFEWINFVREPVSRMVSLYYYLRKPSRWNSKKNRPPESWFEKSLDACVLDEDAECQVPSHVSLIGIVLYQIFGYFWQTFFVWVFTGFDLNRF